MKGNKDEEFEKWWKENKNDILHEDTEYNRVQNSYKIKSGADLLLFGIPVVAGIVYMNYSSIESEILKWIVSAVITIVVFLICVWVKSTTIPGETLSEIEERLKDKFYAEWQKNDKNMSSK